MEGKVYRSTGSWYDVKNLDTGEFIQCRIKGKFRIKGIRTTNPISVGDMVVFDMEEEGKGIIHTLHPRKNYIIRKSINLSKESHIVGSNLDGAYLIITALQPQTSTGFIDRFLVTAEAYGVQPTLVFNKSDLKEEHPDFKERSEDLMALYSYIGYECIETSILDAVSIAAFKKLLSNGVYLFTGHSGAGKSSLLNELIPSTEARVGEISDVHLKGKHTTTFAEMFDLPNGGQIIDTPGIKGFGLIDISADDLALYFPEMKALLNDCKFYNCKHISEPKCAVKEAVEAGEIPIDRYENYVNLFEEDNTKHYR